MTRLLVLVFLMMLPVAQPVLAVTGGDIAITVTVQQTQVAGVEIRPRPDQRGLLGETLTYRFRLQNIGNEADEFHLVGSSSRGWPVMLPGGELTATLVPGPGGASRETIDVELTIPRTETVGVQDTLTLTATSEFDPSVFAERSVISTVVGRGGGPP